MLPNTSKRILCIVFTATVLSIMGCSTQQPFDREKAAKDIADSEKFKDCHTGLNNWDACNWTIYTGQWGTIAGYWGSSKDHPQPDSLKGNPVGYWLYKDKGYLQLSSSPETLTFSEVGRTASRQWILVALPGQQSSATAGQRERWEVPLATKKFVAITNVLREQRMGVRIAQVDYSWVYSLTPLGTELFTNEKLPTPGRNSEWSTPAALTGMDVTRTYADKALFSLANGSWHLEEDCKRADIC